MRASATRRRCPPSPWHYARARDWAYVANNFGRDRSYFDLERDEREENDIADRDRRRTDAIDAAIRRRAGKRLPVYH